MVNIADAWFLSRISDAAAASVGAIMPILGIAFSVYSTLYQAGSGVASQRIGANDHKKLSRTYGVIMQLAIGFGLAMSLFFYFGASFFANVMGLEAEMNTMASIYMSTLGLGSWLLALRFAAAAILASQGKTHWNMWSTALMSVINIALNYVLIDGKYGFPALGVQGIAIASVTAWGISFLFSLAVILWGQKIRVNIPWSLPKFTDMARPIMRIASPAVIEPLSWNFTQIIMTAMVVTMGEVALATRIYAFNLLFTAILYCVAISGGVQIKVAFFVGGGRFEEAHKALISGLKIAIVGVIVFMSTMILISDQLFSIFTDNKAIWALGASVLMIAFIGEIGRASNLIVGAALRSSGDSKYISVYGFTMMWFVALPMTYIFGIWMGLGLIGIWLGTSIDECIRGTINYRRWLSKKWQDKGVYAQQ
ncbi:putative efflux protein, MATE family [Thalassotalea agarivorans]|uniref:Putative efflux protein, MATE family n=2 Tax=Thalassotalea agarivorans TaxID=349064 RepID=A0A1I0C274_THASX|nr:putative efflux protein, MATE family [Thalassotalea agarivorans]